MTFKRCSTCKNLFELDSFSRNKRTYDGLQTVYKECNKFWYKKLLESRSKLGLCRCGKPHRDSKKSCFDCAKEARARALQSKYGISLDALTSMLKAQDWRCGICQHQLETRLGGMAVDHNHSTGKVRGLLCLQCNTGIGNFGESKETLLRAISYLEIE